MTHLRCSQIAKIPVKGDCPMEANPGDTIMINQSDGHVIRVIVGSDRVIVKAENLGTILDVQRDSGITVTARAIEI